MDILNATERFAALDRSKVVFDPERCLHSQDTFSSCTACNEICPVSAITPATPPSFDPSKCSSCLACLPKCPVGAYKADDDGTDLMNCSPRIESPGLELVCGLHPNPDKGKDVDISAVQIRGCLAGLGVGTYLMLFASGKRSVILNLDACAQCPWNRLEDEIIKQVEQANNFIALWGDQDLIILGDKKKEDVQRPVWSAKNPPLSRRDLFQMIARQGQIALARALESGSVGKVNSPSRDRLRINSAVSHLPERVASNVFVVDQGNFATITISESCSACASCAKACPTDAIHFDKSEDEHSFRIQFTGMNCVGCGLCDRVCIEDAVQIDHHPTFDQVYTSPEATVIAEGELERCSHCSSLMAKRAGTNLCSVCEYRQKNPFGSMVPQKVNRISKGS